MTRPVQVLVSPKDDNPYYDLLYGALDPSELVVRFFDGPTRSQTVNLLLAPVSLAFYRRQGYQILHLHWLYKFVLPWSHGHEAARRAMQWWFAVYLWAATRLGLRIVWTAHDLVPHDRIFADDDRARSTLLRRCDLVVALSGATAAQLAAAGVRRVCVIPLASYAGRHATNLDRSSARAHLGLRTDDFVVAWFGKIGPYKGVDLLLEAAARLPDASPVRILVAGECVDPRYEQTLVEGARRAGRRALARFERLRDDEIGSLLVASDLAAFPFREVTNSSSVLTACSFGLPVVLPDLPFLADVPEACALRYDPARDDLAEVLDRAAALPSPTRRAMGEAASAYANGTDWASAARSLLDAYHGLADRR